MSGEVYGWDDLQLVLSGLNADFIKLGEIRTDLAVNNSDSKSSNSLYDISRRWSSLSLVAGGASVGATSSPKDVDTVNSLLVELRDNVFDELARDISYVWSKLPRQEKLSKLLNAGAGSADDQTRESALRAKNVMTRIMTRFPKARQVVDIDKLAERPISLPYIGASGRFFEDIFGIREVLSNKKASVKSDNFLPYSSLTVTNSGTECPTHDPTVLVEGTTMLNTPDYKGVTMYKDLTDNPDFNPPQDVGRGTFEVVKYVAKSYANADTRAADITMNIFRSSVAGTTSVYVRMPLDGGKTSGVTSAGVPTKVFSTGLNPFCDPNYVKNTGGVTEAAVGERLAWVYLSHNGVWYPLTVCKKRGKWMTAFAVVPLTAATDVALVLRLNQSINGSTGLATVGATMAASNFQAWVMVEPVKTASNALLNFSNILGNATVAQDPKKFIDYWEIEDALRQTRNYHDVVYDRTASSIFSEVVTLLAPYGTVATAALFEISWWINNPLLLQPATLTAAWLAFYRLHVQASILAMSDKDFLSFF